MQEILIEKIAALSDKARTEPRDVYDLWRVAAECDLDYGHLANQVAEKIKAKGDDPAGRAGNLEREEKRLALAWQKRLAVQMNDLPEFDGVFREVRRIFRKLGLFETA